MGIFLIVTYNLFVFIRKAVSTIKIIWLPIVHNHTYKLKLSDQNSSLSSKLKDPYMLFLPSSFVSIMFLFSPVFFGTKYHFASSNDSLCPVYV